MGNQKQRALEKRILQFKEDGTQETELEMYERVANFLGDTESEREEFYDTMKDNYFLPNSPCLVNAGVKGRPQNFFACYVLPVEDNMESIFTTLKDAAMIHKLSGGTGFNFSKIRPNGCKVGTTNGVASGVISFMKIFDVATEQVKQGGLRKGANMGVLNIDHPEILDFIKCKSEQNVINNFNLSIGITDEFIDAVKKDELFDLKHDGVVYQTWEARYLFKQIMKHMHNNGEPGILFLDKINKTHKEITGIEEIIMATNPCGEIPLLPYEACCLGSINLSRVTDFILEYGREKKHFYEALEPTIKTAVIFLNKMLDKNEYPLPENKEIAMRNRKIGLGVMGYADMLIKFGLEYGSREALELTKSISRKIQAYAHEVSIQLGYNNKCINTVAPTGSISIIAECSSGIEPLFALEQHIQRMEESFVEVPPIVEWYHKNIGCMGEKAQVALKKHPLFKTANEISYEAHIRTQDAWQQHIDNAVSKTINLPNNATIEDTEKAFWLASELSCKGYTIYRDGSRDSQVISSTAKESKIVEDIKQKEVEEFIRPEKLTATVYKYKTGCGNLYVTVSRDGDGKVVEVFTNTGKNGGCHSQSEALTRITAKALQNGVQHDVVKSQLQGIRCASCISGSARERGVNVLSCPDAISKALNGEIHNEVCNEVKAIVERPIVIPVGAKEMEACTVCGTMSEKTGGCKICAFCGNSKCG